MKRLYQSSKTNLRNSGEFLNPSTPILITLMIFVSTLAFAQPFPDYDIVPVPEINDVEVGDNFTVVMRLEPQSGALISNAELYMTFDPAIVHIASLDFSPSSLLTNSLVAPSFDNTLGELEIGASTFTPPSTAFDFVEIEFIAISNGSTNVAHIFDAFPATLLAYGGQNITGSADPILVNVTTPGAIDCNGDMDGTAFIDNCGDCVGGNTGEVACEQDCNGEYGGPAEEELWYLDMDGDGFGDPNVFVSECDQPDGYVANDLDCDDSNPSINPDADEACDGIDNNCDGLIDNDAGCIVLNGTVDGLGQCDNYSGFIELYEPGSTILVNTYSVSVDAAGDFSVLIEEQGNFDVFLKLDGYLKDGIGNQSLTIGENAISYGTPGGGDLTNSNSIGIQDFSIFSSAYGSSAGDVTYSELADFNCNDQIEISDFAVFSSNYGDSGDEAPL